MPNNGNNPRSGPSDAELIAARAAESIRADLKLVGFEANVNPRRDDFGLLVEVEVPLAFRESANVWHEHNRSRGSVRIYLKGESS